MAGLVAAARMRELGVDPVVIEKGARPGGSMLLSSCVIWRHRRFEDFRAECPGGDETLQRLIWERLDDALAWLVRKGAPVVWEETRNPLTTGKRFEPRRVSPPPVSIEVRSRGTHGDEANVDVNAVADTDHVPQKPPVPIC